MPAKAMNAAFLFDPGKALIYYEHPMDIAIAPSMAVISVTMVGLCQACQYGGGISETTHIDFLYLAMNT